MLESSLVSFYQNLDILMKDVENLSIFYLSILVFIAGFSQAVGHSGTLFINKVKPERFVLSLLSATFLYLAQMSLWLILIWLCCRGIQMTSIELVARALIISRIPQVFAFLEFLPSLGVAQARIISALGLIILSFTLSHTTEIILWQTILIVLSTWLAIAFVKAKFSGKLVRVNKSNSLSKFFTVRTLTEQPFRYDMRSEVIMQEVVDV